MDLRTLATHALTALCTYSCLAGTPLPPSTWTRVADSTDGIPGTASLFTSFNQPSVNIGGLVVFRARGAGPQTPPRGVFVRDMQAGLPISAVVVRGTTVPDPNNTTYSSGGSSALSSFLEFPAIPRIDARSDALATRGQSRPVWTFLLPDATESRLGTSGVYARMNGTLSTGASLLGAVTDAATGVPQFSEYSVPGAAGLSRFDQFPGSPSITNGTIIAYKGNYTDSATGISKTGVFFRDLSSSAIVQTTQLVANSDMLIPGQSSGKGGGKVLFGSTAPPSAADGRVVFLGVDNEESPTLGGIYIADLVPSLVLKQLVAIGGRVPGEPEGTGFTRLGEALSFDGRWVAFWAGWGSETRTLTLSCPEDGSAAMLEWCNEQYPDGFVAEVPVHQGIFVHDTRSGITQRVATAGNGGDFDDFLFWVFSGRAPGSGSSEEGDESLELARWRNSSFVAVCGAEVVGDGKDDGKDDGKNDGKNDGRDDSSADCFCVAFKGRMRGVDGIHVVRSGESPRVIGALTTRMPGVVLDPSVSAGLGVVAVGLEREALRGRWLTVAGSMLDPITSESRAGIYAIDVEAIPSCVGDINGSASVDALDIAMVFNAWGICGHDEGHGVCIEDLNQDGKVDGMDLSIVLSGWGDCW